MLDSRKSERRAATARGDFETESTAGRLALPATVELTDDEFARLSRLVYELAGINLGDGKRQLVAGRLGRRLRVLGLDSYAQYYDRISGPRADAAERENFVNSLTTNTTDFFREKHHFEYLRDQIIPETRQRFGNRNPRLRIWSAGCSSGEEPYSIAMTLRDALGGEIAEWSIEILATDLDTTVLGHAKKATYQEERLAQLDLGVRKRHFLRGYGGNSGLWQVRDENRELVRFERRNLVVGEWPTEERFDLIFCRNVIIYFDRETQSKLFRRFTQRLRPGGHLIIGHSETLHTVNDEYDFVGQTIHRKIASPDGASRSVRPSRVRVGQDPRPRARVEVPAETKVTEYRIIVGETKASRQPAVVRTLLGSCVSACLFDPTSGVGGMNHFLLPDGDPGSRNAAYFGVHAMEVLINEIMKLGGDRRALRGKLVGAGHVLGIASDVPHRNAEFARNYLRAEGIPIDGERLGGTRALEVCFYTHSGRTLVRMAGEDQVAGTVAAERAAVSAQRRVSMDVELFQVDAGLKP